MPTYDYLCNGCDHRFEQFQSITASPLKKCPRCGKPKLRRLIGAGGGVIFKGSGFYQTDHRSKSYKDAASKESKESKAGKESGGSSASGGSSSTVAGATSTSGSASSPSSSGGTSSSDGGGKGDKKT